MHLRANLDGLDHGHFPRETSIGPTRPLGLSIHDSFYMKTRRTLRRYSFFPGLCSIGASLGLCLAWPAVLKAASSRPPNVVFILTDNQGAWHGSSTLKPGSFQGHPGGLAWYDKAPNMGPRPVEPNDKSRMVAERERIKELVPPAVYMVHGKIGNSSSFIVCDTSKRKFGPFQKQIFVADQCFSNISRVFLEEVNGIKQGVVFPFLQGFKSGLLAGRMNENGQLLVGGSDRGWGSKGGKRFCFDRVDWTGKVPFEVLEMRAKPDGFELTFTEAVDPATSGNPASYKTRAFTYIYQSEYGSPEVDEVVSQITKAVVGADNKSVRLTFDKLTKGHVHELHLDGVKSTTGLPVLHPSAYYTLNEIPAK